MYRVRVSLASLARDGLPRSGWTPAPGFATVWREEGAYGARHHRLRRSDGPGHRQPGKPARRGGRSARANGTGPRGYRARALGAGGGFSLRADAAVERLPGSHRGRGAGNRLFWRALPGSALAGLVASSRGLADMADAARGAHSPADAAHSFCCRDLAGDLDHGRAHLAVAQLPPHDYR